ncbi:MAG TPA: hypothetical protein PLB04_13585 [Nitrospira sp.]|nr:hypothetical protein [Nitrospira sp.]
MKTTQILLSALTISVLNACGGGGGSSTSQSSGSVSGVVTKGPLNAATVTAFAIASGQMGNQLASGVTDATGAFSVALNGYSGPLMLQVSGGNFVDEATGLTMGMAPGDVMTLVIPSASLNQGMSGLQITPVTSMAQTLAEHMAGGMTDANIQAANAATGSYFSVGDIVHTAPMNPLTAGSGANAGVNAQNYGMVLASISQYAQMQGVVSTSTMVSVLMKDAADGLMDGMNFGAPIMISTVSGSLQLPAGAGSTGLGGAMSTFMNSARNRSGVTTMPLMNRLNGTAGQMMSGSSMMGGR